MKTLVDERLRREAAENALRHRCDDCVHFEPEGERCSHGYPTAEHRASLAHEPTRLIVFCKEFELA